MGVVSKDIGLKLKEAWEEWKKQESMNAKKP